MSGGRCIHLGARPYLSDGVSSALGPVLRRLIPLVRLVLAPRVPLDGHGLNRRIDHLATTDHVALGLQVLTILPVQLLD